MEVIRNEYDEGKLRLDLNVAGQEYPIFLGSGVMGDFAQYLNPGTEHLQSVLMMDENTSEIFGLPFEAHLITAGFLVEAITIAEGDQSKSWATAGQVLELLAELKVERQDLLISLGGGMISDLTGFCAAVYLRGIDFAQISTSLLSMVDASVGGKTAVNLQAGKNLAGAFKQPRAIAMDLDAIESLPPGEFASGMAEIIKTALLAGEEFVSWIEEKVEEIKARDPQVMMEMIARCIEYKAGVVERDPFEKGERAWLNLGHTLGHGVEHVLGYGTISHGLAVAEGTRFAARLSAELLKFPIDDIRRIDNLFDVFGLFELENAYDPKDLMDAMRRDKKVSSGALRFVLLSKIGDPQVHIVEENTVYDHLRAWAQSRKPLEVNEQ